MVTEKKGRYIMQLSQAVELLQGTTFNMEESFWSELGGYVTADYTLEVVDAETLLNDIDVNLNEVSMDDLRNTVEDGLYNILNVGSDGVKIL
ncbi:hypothetical protein LGL73_13960 [Staphylococcus aureus]|uniref:hypothetical protein n=1 Tax=Staphylococcus aureus TaxID=1280 RepID=UPI001CF2A1E4|nr:hypothetical protein [Staphylococcus aureus]MCA7081846.1 hypothetical protein [Staphylococcus aureus]